MARRVGARERTMTTTLIPPRGGLAAVLAFLFALGAVQTEAQDKSLTLVMPPCPINAITVPPNKTGFPSADPLGAALNVAGTVQVTDQRSNRQYRELNPSHL